MKFDHIPISSLSRHLRADPPVIVLVRCLTRRRRPQSLFSLCKTPNFPFAHLVGVSNGGGAPNFDFSRFAVLFLASRPGEPRPRLLAFDPSRAKPAALHHWTFRLSKRPCQTRLSGGGNVSQLCKIVMFLACQITRKSVSNCCTRCCSNIFT